MNDFVTTSNITYDLRNPRELSNEGKHTVTYGLQSISYRAPILWSLLPQPLKNIDNLITFKREIKKWQGDNSAYADYVRTT